MTALEFKEQNRDIHVMVSNIPKEYRSSDLRNYFSQLVETGAFSCFHYRHRPSITTTVVNDPADRSSSSTSPSPVFCCVIRVNGDRHFKQLTAMYHGKHWVNSDGDSSRLRCHIAKIKVTETGKSCHEVYQTRLEQKTIPKDRVEFTGHDLSNLIEMRPPALMPNGNVGTPTSHFRQLIGECRMPVSVIRKLGLVFQTRRGRRIYGSVPFDYGQGVMSTDDETTDHQDEDVLTARGHRISDVYLPTTTGHDAPSTTRDPEILSEEDDDDGEEWDRHESLHDNVTEQERAKERLYEEEIELKWEKGGSGLVFYTDAQYWEEQKGDFDEITSDDWDVDYSIYYEKDGGDKDARDYVQMRREDRLRSGRHQESVFDKKIGRFERHTKGFGRKLMERQGWTDGHGLGKTAAGIADALDNGGQHPRDKRGLGYYGEKLVRFPIKKPRTDFHISTIYDEPSLIDPSEPLLRSGPQTTLKHREK